MNNSVVIFYSNVWPAMWDGLLNGIVLFNRRTAVGVRKSPPFRFVMECATSCGWSLLPVPNAD